MDELRIKKIEISDKRLDIEMEITGRWSRYIRDTHFFCGYNKSIEGVPGSIAVIPLLGNILPIAWVYDLEINVASIDKSFYEGIPAIKDGYRAMYPKMTFTDRFTVGEIEDGRPVDEKKSACFFSGGVDAYFSFLRHLKEKPDMATVWGSDIMLDDIEGWDNVYHAVTKAASRYGVGNYIIQSNFREVINAKNLSEDLHHPGWSWWHEFQHGIGLITLMAPMAYMDRISRLYIAASYTADVKGLTCASDPSIDDHVAFSHCKVIHDGFEADRQEKVRYIVEHSKRYHDPVDLRVCWVSRGGKNCCVCEKCCRTMTAIYLEGGVVTDFGFSGKDTDLNRIAWNMRYKNSGLPRDWDILHERFKEKYTSDDVPDAWRWFYKGGTDSINRDPIYRISKWKERLMQRSQKSR